MLINPHSYGDSSRFGFKGMKWMAFSVVFLSPWITPKRLSTVRESIVAMAIPYRWDVLMGRYGKIKENHIYKSMIFIAIFDYERVYIITYVYTLNTCICTL